MARTLSPRRAAAGGTKKRPGRLAGSSKRARVGPGGSRRSGLKGTKRRPGRLI